MAGCAPQEPEQEPSANNASKTFHRRTLPPPAIEFSSKEGKQIFKEALDAGTMGCFFRLIEQFHTQNEPAFCGLGTLTMVLNALNVDPQRTWKGPWRWFHEEMLDCCEPLEEVKKRGITWPKWLCLARCNGAYIEAHRADEPSGDLDTFRRLVCSSACQDFGGCAEEQGKPLKILAVSYSRKQFGQTGDGHYSPIGGYHKERDLILVLDVARFKHPPHWVPLEEMHESMKRIDPDTKRSRGFALLAAQPKNIGCLCLKLRPSYISLSLEDVEADFVNCLCAALRGTSTEDDALAVASKVLESAMSFCESPQMPMIVTCIRSDDRALQQADLESCAQTLEGLRQVASELQRIVGESYGEHTKFDSTSGLSDDEMRAAMLLSLDLSLWTRVLSPACCRASPSKDLQPLDMSEEKTAVWEILKPLLMLDSFPESLQQEVTTLRGKFMERLTTLDGPSPSSCCDSGCSR